MKKKATILLAALLVIASLFGCSSSKSESGTTGSTPSTSAASDTAKPIEIIFAIHTNAGTNENDTLERYKKLVEERSGGKLTISLYPGAVLGSELENLEQVKMGEVQMSIFGDNLTSKLAAEYDPTVVPFIFENVDQVYEVWNGPVGDKIKAAIEERGNQYLVALQTRGARNLTASKKITAPGELKGLKLRVPEITSWVTVWKSLGALPTPIAWSETYSALQTGVADGQENPLENIYVNKIYEVNKYTVMTQHLYNVFHWTINKDFYDGLDPELQKILMDTAAECCEWGNEQLAAKEAKILEDLKAAGNEIVEVDKEAFIKAARPGLEEVAKTWDPEVWEVVKGYLE